MNKTISIIIPVYNVEMYLPKCLESVINQSYENIEIILIDDGATDSCGKICDEYKLKDNRITVIHKKNEGLMQAWIDGIKIAHGEYVSFIDSDDWVEHNIIEEMVQNSQELSVDMVVVNKINEYEDKSVKRPEYLETGVYDSEEITKKVFPGIINNCEFLGRNISSNRWGKLIRRQLIIDNLKYTDSFISYGEDMNIIMPVLMDCKKIVVVDKYLYHYRQNANSIIHKYKKNMLAQLDMLNEKLLEAAKDKQMELENQIERNYLCMFTEVVKNEFQNQDKWKKCKIRIDELCSNKDIKKLLAKHSELRVRGANRLIIYYIKQPNILLALFIRLLFKLKNRF